jgi:hypothetical protein
MKERKESEIVIKEYAYVGKYLKDILLYKRICCFKFIHVVVVVDHSIV